MIGSKSNERSLIIRCLAMWQINMACPSATHGREVKHMTTKRKMVKDFDAMTLVLYGITFKLSDLPKGIQAKCALHGMCQKLVDSTAGMNSKDYTDDERKEKIKEVYATLKSNLWAKPAEGKSTIKKKVDAAIAAATPEELALLKKLGLA